MFEILSSEGNLLFSNVIQPLEDDEWIQRLLVLAFKCNTNIFSQNLYNLNICFCTPSFLCFVYLPVYSEAKLLKIWFIKFFNATKNIYILRPILLFSLVANICVDICPWTNVSLSFPPLYDTDLWNMSTYTLEEELVR